MKREKLKIFACDFETTVFQNQKDTQVWASALTEINNSSENVLIFGSIEKTFAFLCQQNAKRTICYYHNLKFDGSFWLDFLLRNKKFKQAFKDEKDKSQGFKPDFEMLENEFKYSISELGMWYSITIKLKYNYIEFRDSLKLLPFTLAYIGKSFKTKHQKLQMNYEGFRYPNCNITVEEKEYIKNDVLVLKEALETAFSMGYDKLTIGSCCMADFKKILVEKRNNYDIPPLLYDNEVFNWLMPDLSQITIDEKLYGAKTADDFIRKSYKGGWCYVKKEIQGLIVKNGVCADVNSLYPSEMHSTSGNKYPIGKPYFFYGSIPEHVKNSNNKYYFVKIKTRFKLKKGFLPTIQIKNNLYYKPTEWLESSDFIYKGEFFKNAVELTLTMTDYELIKQHYKLIDCIEICGCYFESLTGIFDDYINKYAKIKMESEGAKRTLAKLSLNNLYGKTATSTDSSFKIAFLKDNALSFSTYTANDKKAGHIAIGSAITSYARYFTITTAQKNYNNFCYADTDSIHCTCKESELKGVNIHDSKFRCWKIENTFDTAKFLRQKTYVEINDKETIVKCAGMPENCKKVFINDLQQGKKSLNDFDIGLKINGKLIPKRIKGGTLLVPTTFEIK